MNLNNEYYQANALVQARTKNYDIVEHRLFRMAIADLNPKLKNSKYYNEEFPTFHLSTAEVVAEFQGEDGNSNSIYERLLIAYRNMIQSYVEVGDPKNPKLYPIFAEIDFSIKNGLTIQFNPKMKPFLLNFENGNYTRCFLEMAFELSSKYSLILLELMLQYRGTQKNKVIERRITPEELRFALDVKDNTYKLMQDFIKKVINPAIKQINERTNYYINPEYKIERGRWRKIKAFVFTMILPDADAESKPKIKPKKEDIPAVDNATTAISAEDNQTEHQEEYKKAKKKINEVGPAELPPTNQQEEWQEEPKKPKKRLEDFTKEEAYALAKLLKFKIVEKVAFVTLEKYGVKAINWAVQNYQNAKNRGVVINNPAGFILDKIAEYDEFEVTAEDIFALVEKFKSEEEQERIKEQEEAERQKAEEKAKEETAKMARLEIRKQYTDAELLQVLSSVLSDYYKNKETITEKMQEQLNNCGFTSTDLILFKMLDRLPD